MSGINGLALSCPNTLQSLSALLNTLPIFSEDPTFAANFSKAFEIREFQLGDELTRYSLTNPSENFVQGEQNSGGFYVVCQGRVRLLGFDAAQGREVSAMVLEAPESFGMESVFADVPSLTRAIAASDGQVAWISPTNSSLG